MQIFVIIPAYNEEESLPFVIADIDQSFVNKIFVVDNGSTDRTAQVALDAGAVVLSEARRGYGNACLKGIYEVEKYAKGEDVVVFMDADYSDYPSELPLLIKPIQQNLAELVIGSRIQKAEQGSLSLPQRFGNFLASFFLSIFFQTRITDLGPFRAIRLSSLQALTMRDKKYGWTIEMQIKAAYNGLRVVEVPVSYRKRKAGRSKVSGTVKGVVLAGSYIGFYLLAALLFAIRKKFSGR